MTKKQRKHFVFVKETDLVAIFKSFYMERKRFVKGTQKVVLEEVTDDIIFFDRVEFGCQFLESWVMRNFQTITISNARRHPIYKEIRNSSIFWNWWRFYYAIATNDYQEYLEKTAFAPDYYEFLYSAAKGASTPHVKESFNVVRLAVNKQPITNYYEQTRNRASTGANN